MDRNNNGHQKTSRRRLPAFVCGLSILGTVLGCSTSESTSATTGSGWLPPVFPPGANDGKFVWCRTNGGEVEDVTCMKKELVGCHPMQPFRPEAGEFYMKAMCAMVFDGEPSDYDPVDLVTTPVTDYPDIGQQSYGDCETARDYTVWEYESPVVSNNVPFYGPGTPEECTVEAYCAWIEAANSLWPDDVPFYFDLIPQFEAICNLSPGGIEGYSGPWQCVGSTDAACGTINGNESLCPIDDFIGDPLPGQEVCVISQDANSAEQRCRSQCLRLHNDYVEKDLMGMDEYEPADYMDCTVYTTETVEWVSDPDAQCHAILYPANYAPRPFGFTLSVVTDGGSSAVSPNNTGQIEYQIGTCTGGQCPITISGVHVPACVYQGTVYPPTGAPYSYEVSGVSLALTTPVTGVVQQLRGTVTFPTDAFVVAVSAQEIGVGGLSLAPLEHHILTVDQVVGSYRNGNLTLNISYNTIDADVSVVLTTQ